MLNGTALSSGTNVVTRDQRRHPGATSSSRTSVVTPHQRRHPGLDPGSQALRVILVDSGSSPE